MTYTTMPSPLRPTSVCQVARSGEVSQPCPLAWAVVQAFPARSTGMPDTA